MFKLPPLPYAKDALAPHVSAETLSFHHGKHHKTYVDKPNDLVKGTALEKLELVPLIRKVAGVKSKQTIFNNAAQIWNHDFYWHSMSPDGGGKPKGALAARIDKDFGGFSDFKKAFAEAGAGQFGSGYVWLVASGAKLRIMATANAETPVSDPDLTPLLTTDVWEHTYYLDYQNRRPDYLDAFLGKLVNWDFAAANYEKA